MPSNGLARSAPRYVRLDIGIGLGRDGGGYALIINRPPFSKVSLARPSVRLSVRPSARSCFRRNVTTASA